MQVDTVSRLVTASGETSIVDLEAELRRFGLTLGIATDSRRTVTSHLREPSPLDRSPRYGRLIDAVVGLEVRTTDGRQFRSSPAPRKAVGPDWRALVVDSHAIVERATLRAHGKPQSETLFSWLFATQNDALVTARAAVRADVLPATWCVVGTTLAGRLEGLSGVVAAEEAALLELARQVGAQKTDPVNYPVGLCRVQSWSDLLANTCSTAEMTLDGGVALDGASDATLQRCLDLL